MNFNRNKITNSINEEAKKIDGFVEMILFYARSQMPEKDYLIKNCKLTNIVNKVIMYYNVSDFSPQKRGFQICLKI